MNEPRRVGRGVHQTLYLRPEVKYLLDAFCAVVGVARGEMVRRLLVAELKQNEDTRRQIWLTAPAHKLERFQRMLDLNHTEEFIDETAAESRI